MNKKKHTQIFHAYMNDQNVPSIRCDKTNRSITVVGNLAAAAWLVDVFHHNYTRKGRTLVIAERSQLTRDLRYLVGLIDEDARQFNQNMLEPIERSDCSAYGIVYRYKRSGAHTYDYLTVIKVGKERMLVRFFEDCSVLIAVGLPALLYAVPIGRLKAEYLTKVTVNYNNKIEHS